MLRSTFGTWVNYTTTIALQILFASRFGSSAEASGYLISFALVIAIGAVFVSTAQSLYVPRLVSLEGLVLSRGLRKIGALTVWAAGIFGLLAVLAPLLEPIVFGGLDGTTIDLAALLRIAAAFGLLQVLAGQLSTVAWARGNRLIPAIGPALPSIGGAVALVLVDHLSPYELYVVMSAGTLAQIGLLGVVVLRRLRLSREAMQGMARLTLATVGVFAVMTLLPPLELVVASRGSASAGANYNYALRSLTVVQQLIVGGVTAAALAEWSNFVRLGLTLSFKRSIARAVAVSLLALSAAASVAIVASTSLIEVVFEHGNFTRDDTLDVGQILLVALAGFVAEGVMFVVSQALLATRRNRASVVIGVGRSGLRLGMVLALGLPFGPIGVAAAYSIANVVTLIVQVAYLVRLRLLSRSEGPWSNAAVVLAATVATSVVLVQTDIPPFVAAACVITVCAATTVAMWDELAKSGVSRLRGLRVRRSGRLTRAIMVSGAALAAVAGGVAVARAPQLMLLIGFAALLAATGALLPLRYFPALLILGSLLVPSLLTHGVAGAGQARLVMLVVAVVGVRALAERHLPRMPRIVVFALLAALAALLITTIVGLGRPASDVGTMSDLSRDLAYPFCAVIGYFAATNARETGRLLSIPRTLAVLTIVASVASLAYWAWASGRVTLAGVGSLFDEVQAASVYAPSRSIFPFTQDAPNLGAVAFVLLGALAVPPLLRSARRLDTTLAIAAISAVAAGVLTTQSRTGLLALAAASLAYLVLVPRTGGRRHVVVLALVVAGIATGAVIKTFPPDRSLSTKTDTLQAREQIWGQAFDAFLSEPIVGHGYRYSQVGNFVETASVGGAGTSRLVSTHSDYLSQLVDGGIVAAVIFLGILAAMVSTARRAISQRVTAPAGLGYACFLSALLVAMVDSTTSQSAVVASVVWLGFGCTLGLIARREAASPTAWPPLQAPSRMWPDLPQPWSPTGTSTAPR